MADGIDSSSVAFPPPPSHVVDLIFIEEESGPVGAFPSLLFISFHFIFFYTHPPIIPLEESERGWRGGD